MSVFNVDVDLTFASGLMSVGVRVLEWVWVAGPSEVDLITMLMEAFEVTEMFLTSNNHDRQTAGLLWTPDIHSKVMLYMVSSSDHVFTMLFAYLPLRNLCRGLWLLCTAMSDPSR